MSAHYFAYSAHCIEAIVCSISYFNCPKYMITFSASLLVANLAMLSFIKLFGNSLQCR